MEAKELRIGNYVYDPINKENVKLVAIEQGNRPITLGGKGTSSFSGFDCLQPIPLTEEILLKCGFEKIENGWKVLDFIYFKISWERLAGLTLTFENESVYLPHIKYIHQLQTLYFALTNEELTVTL